MSRGGPSTSVVSLIERRSRRFRGAVEDLEEPSVLPRGAWTPPEGWVGIVLSALGHEAGTPSASMSPPSRSNSKQDD